MCKTSCHCKLIDQTDPDCEGQTDNPTKSCADKIPSN